MNSFYLKKVPKNEILMALTKEKIYSEPELKYFKTALAVLERVKEPVSTSIIRKILPERHYQDLMEKYKTLSENKTSPAF